MSKVIAYGRPDGGVSIVHPVYALQADETEEAFLARVAAKAVPEGTPYKILERAQIPDDRFFRNAWALAGEKFEVPIERAREVAKAHIRPGRDEILNKLDKLKEKASEQGDHEKVARIISEKQRLRDLPASLDSLTTLKELKAVKAETSLK